MDKAQKDFKNFLKTNGETLQKLEHLIYAKDKRNHTEITHELYTVLGTTFAKGYACGREQGGWVDAMDVLPKVGDVVDIYSASSKERVTDCEFIKVDEDSYKFKQKQTSVEYNISEDLRWTYYLPAF